MASHRPTKLDHLGDFTTSPRVLSISLLAIAIGFAAAFIAAALLELIGLCTNLFFFQRVSTELVSPAGHHLGPFVVLVPVAGALIIGAMARWGSERIRGHGMPEAIEAILMTGGAVGSLVAQFFHLTSTERKTLLVSGAAAGMSATFAAPVASVMLAVELLLFEWQPRSIV